MPMHIRRARGDEAALLSDLALRSKGVWGYNDAFIERCRPVLTVSIDDVAARPVFVAEVNGSIAGFYSLRQDGRDIAIDLLFVEPSYIGAGVGRALLEHALGLAAEMGCARATVVSDPFAEPFYARLGGRRVGSVTSEVEDGRQLPLLEFALETEGRGE